ncbi:Eukaryotic translation initiation factor 3 subunit A [Clarias magur]|uniref:Eukaryotic translation initiation factor 3 subunit A n=1 Tax=Clarias magur TaxID=1594786 RepID=A0A8J4U6K4_CLAMG|nr:Eukaryotic translation initiation factor 3 subunit A [Clarias magur]
MLNSSTALGQFIAQLIASVVCRTGHFYGFTLRAAFKHIRLFFPRQPQNLNRSRKGREEAEVYEEGEAEHRGAETARRRAAASFGFGHGVVDETHLSDAGKRERGVFRGTGRSGRM